MTEATTDLALFELLSLDCRVDEYGIIRYFNAQEQLHRVHGPAIVYTDGSRAWFQNGQFHRLDGPAVDRADGYRAWYHNGRPHRLAGPAIEWPDGYRTWYHNGLRHRLDGPAVEWPAGYCAWYIDGKELTQAKWQQAVANMERV